MGDHASADPDGYLAFARSLARPYIYDLISRADPLTEPVPYAFPSNRRRRYERLKRPPERFLVMGDALCSFNPIYGQGMSVAALEALALGDAIGAAEGLNAVGARFFPKAAAIVDGPWAVAAGGDLAFEGVTGRRPFGTGLVNWYLGQVHRAAATDPEVCLAFFQAANLFGSAHEPLQPEADSAGGCEQMAASWDGWSARTPFGQRRNRCAAGGSDALILVGSRVRGHES